MDAVSGIYNEYTKLRNGFGCEDSCVRMAVKSLGKELIRTLQDPSPPLSGITSFINMAGLGLRLVMGKCP